VNVPFVGPSLLLNYILQTVIQDNPCEATSTEACSRYAVNVPFVGPSLLLNYILQTVIQDNPCEATSTEACSRYAVNVPFVGPSLLLNYILQTDYLKPNLHHFDMLQHMVFSLE
jgi:hypothetical protein